jgi:hypothetical protein
MKQIVKKNRLKFYVFSILAITILSGCSKQNPTTTPPANSPFIISVFERNTNKPIAGATVSLRKCSNYDFVFGCTAYSTFTTLTTNTEGKATSRISGIDEIKVEANNYWTLYKKTDIQNVILTPKTSIEVNVKREKTYAPTDILSIGQDRYFTDLKSIGLPVDTIVYIDGYGYSENKIYWYINYWNGPIVNTGSTGGSSPNFYINGFDTARILIKY